MDSLSPKPDPVVAEVKRQLEAMGLIVVVLPPKMGYDVLRVLIPHIH